MQVGSNRFISSSSCPCWQPWLVLLRERLLGRERRILCWCSTERRGRISGWNRKKEKSNGMKYILRLFLTALYELNCTQVFVICRGIPSRTMWWRRHGVPDQRQTVTGTGTPELEVEGMKNTSEEQSRNDISKHRYSRLIPDIMYKLFVKWYVKSLTNCVSNGLTPIRRGWHGDVQICFNNQECSCFRVSWTDAWFGKSKEKC